MITNTGKKVLVKYLIGQTPSYASYIAIGCGAAPLTTLPGDLTVYSDKTSLDFEMFRVPVTSRGYVVENGVQKIVLTAQLPAEERYEISEIGLYPGISNPTATGFDSRTLFSFSTNENWERHDANGSSTIPKVIDRLSATATSEIVPNLDIGNATFVSISGTAGDYTVTAQFASTDNIAVGDTISWLDGTSTLTGTIETISGQTVAISSTASTSSLTNIKNTDIDIFQANSDNSTFDEELRLGRLERPRFFNNTIFMRGDTSTITTDVDGSLLVASGAKHIHLNNISIDLSKHSPLDELRLAFSVVNKSGDPIVEVPVPANVKIIVEFCGLDGTALSTATYAKAEIVVPAASLDDANKSYVVKNVPIRNLVISSFVWSAVKSIKIYAAIEPGAGQTSSDYYVALDALRIENISSTNPVYGLTGYSPIVNSFVNSNGVTIVRTISKEPNTSNYVEFKFTLDVT